MDSRHHSIQLSAGFGSLTASPVTQLSDDEMMSSELHLAVCAGRKKEAMALLTHCGVAAGAHHVAGLHKIVTAERNNVLHLAAGQGHHCLIKELYASFGDKRLLSSQNSALDTPLHCAARAGHHGAVSLLVKYARGCGDESLLWCKNEAGDTALHLATRLGHAAVVQVIVSAAPVLASEVNGAGVSALYLAVVSGSVPAVRAITSKCSDASAVGPSSQNALHAAVFKGTEIVRLLLDWKPSLASEADSSGSTPLHFASSDGDQSVLGSILRTVPPWVVRMQDSGGLSALHVAAEIGHSRVAKALIDACPDAAELRDDSSRTFVHTAARGGHSKVVLLAFKKPTLRCLLNMQDGDGNTPLHLAVSGHVPNVAEVLLRYGKVRADVMNNDGHTPLDLAARSTSLFSMLGLVITLAAFGAQSRPQRRDHVVQWSGGDIIPKGIEKISDSLAVVAVLIATVAFTAASNVPGSYEQADDTEKMVFKGMAVLQGKNVFKCFLFLDSFALVTSVIAVILLVFGKASRSDGSWKSFAVALHCIWVSLISMILAFYAALSAVTWRGAVHNIIYQIIYVAFSGLFILVANLVKPSVSFYTIWKFLWQFTFKAVVRRRIRQQYQVVGAFAINLIVFSITNQLAFFGLVIISHLK